MAVLLVLASGTAVSLAVTDGESSAVGSNAAVQETTEVGQETTDAGNEETTEVVDEETTAAEEGDDTADEAASVTINDQESDGEQIVIEEVTMDEGGFIAIHDETLLEGDAIGSVVGTSVYLEAGTHENVTVTLGRPVAESQTLIAMPHQDTNDNEVYDFVISGGEADGPYTATDSGAVVDEASVTVGEDGVDETTEEVDDVETTEVDDVETTEVDDVETTEEDEVIETTTEEVDDVETTEVDDVETTEVDDVETTEVDDVETTEEDDVDDVETTEVDDVETTEIDDAEAPAGEQQVVFKVEQMNIDRWSFVLGDEEEPDRTETVSDITVQDRRVEINLTELLQQQSQMTGDQVTTQDPEEVREQVEDNFSGDIQTVRFVIENVNVENVTFVITAPADMELPETPEDTGPEMTTEVEDDDGVETTEEDEVIETTTEEVDDVETTEVDDVETTEVDDVETTEEDEVIETTTEEVDDVETTEVDDVETTAVDDVETTEDEVVETTTEEVDDVETTEEADGVETTEQELESFDVAALNAPESADIGDNITVSAVVENPNDVEATQDVAFRLQGTVVAREQVTLNASGSTTVEFEVDTSDVPPGEYVHGVYTRDFGELAVITLNEPSAEETDDAVETETEVGDEETELPDDGEETTEPVVTTTTEA